MNAQTRHSRQSAIRVRAGSFSFCILRNNCGPAYGRDIIDRPARHCGFGRISQNLFGPLIAARRGFLRAFHAFHGSARGNAVTDGRHLRSGSPRN